MRYNNNMTMDKKPDFTDRREGPRRAPYPPTAWFWLLCIGWSLAVLSSLAWNMFAQTDAIRNHALHDADVYFKKTISFRQWGAEHGGVYVPITKNTPPNPLLSFIPERDIETPSGKKLTMMNPAYMTRQLFELEERALKVRGHLTSLKPLRSENSADEWETKALNAFELGKTEVVEINDIDGKEHMRVMRPLYVEKACLKCHAQQGYREGEVRGGISISLPMAPFWASAELHTFALRLTHGLIWFIGITGLALSMKTVREHVFALDNVTQDLRKNRDKLKRSLTNSIKSIGKTVEARDPYTAGHQKNVAYLSVCIAKELGFEEERIEVLNLGASIHDIGKIKIPAEILVKPTSLSDHEYLLIQGHPQDGFDIIKDIDFPLAVKNIVLQHHERMDGSGYPQGLKGDEIDLEARIVAVADVVEAMSSNRPYRPGKGIDIASNEVQKQSGIKLDADVVNACLKVISEKKWPG